MFLCWAYLLAWVQAFKNSVTLPKPLASDLKIRHEKWLELPVHVSDLMWNTYLCTASGACYLKWASSFSEFLKKCKCEGINGFQLASCIYINNNNNNKQHSHILLLSLLHVLHDRCTWVKFPCNFETKTERRSTKLRRKKKKNEKQQKKTNWATLWKYLNMWRILLLLGIITLGLDLQTALIVCWSGC